MGKKWVNIQPWHEVIISMDEGSMEDQPWPLWLDLVIELSHLALAFSCSINFYIYILKYKAIRRQHGIVETALGNWNVYQEVEKQQVLDP